MAVVLCFRVKELRKDSPMRSKSFNNSEVRGQGHSPKKITPTGALFHPSNIQYSSTPKVKATPHEAASDPLDLSNSLQEAHETPIRGHQVQRSRSSSHRGTSEEEGEGEKSPSSSGGTVNNVARPDPSTLRGEVNKASKMTGKHARTDSTKSDGQLVTAHRVSKEDRNNKILSNNGKMYKSEGTLLDKGLAADKSTQPLKSSIRRSHSAHGVGKAFSPHGEGGPSTHSTPRSSRTSSSRSDEEIIREHQEIMSHLDVVLDKAKSVMKKTS